MNPDQPQQSLGEQGLTKLIKYQQRQSLLLEIKSIEHYRQVLQQGLSEVHMEQLNQKVSISQGYKDQLYELSQKMNLKLQFLIDTTPPTAEQIDQSREYISSILRNLVIRDRDNQVFNILEDNITQNFYQLLAEFPELQQLQMEKSVQNNLSKQYTEFCKQEAPICDIENEARIISQYYVKQQQIFNSLQQVIIDLEKAFQHEKQQQELLQVSQEDIQQLADIEANFINNFTSIKNETAGNSLVKSYMELLTQYHLPEIIADKKQDSKQEEILQEIKNLIPKTQPLNLLYKKLYDLQQFSQNQVGQESEEQVRFAKNKTALNGLSKKFINVFDQIRKSDTDSSDILKSVEQDIYHIQQNLFRSNNQLQELDISCFASQQDSSQVNVFNQLVNEINAFQNPIQGQLTQLFTLQSIIKQKVLTNQRPINIQSFTNEQLCFSEQKHQFSLLIAQIEEQIKDYTEQQIQFNIIQANSMIMQKKFDTTASKFAQSFLKQEQLKMCQNCENRQWEYVKIAGGDKQCQECANQEFQLILKEQQESQYDEYFIKAIL